MSSNDTKTQKYLELLDEKLNATNARLDALQQGLMHIVDMFKEQVDNGKLNTVEQALEKHLKPVHSTLFSIKSVSSMIARRMERPRKKIRVAFLVHSVETWDALHEVYMLMKQDDRFDAFAVTLQRDFLNNGNFGQEQLNCDGLMELGIHPRRFTGEDHVYDLAMLRLMEPDIIFRQSPWDISVPPAFHFHELNFAKICYVSYGFGCVDLAGGGSNLYFMRSCWRAYCETEIHRQLWAQSVSTDQVKASGSAKLDRILASRDVAQWPMQTHPGDVRIIWAPHHSLTDDWLYFSTFMSNYKQFLQLARECPNLQIVLKPHPALTTKLVSYGLLTEAEVATFLQDFIGLPNTALVTGANYIPLFWASDIMITDGLGFFAEYMVTGKPIIWTENPGHFKLNEIGEILQQGMYRATEFDQVVAYLEQLCVEQNDPLLAKREEIIAQIMPHAEGSAQFIVNDILQGMAEE